MALGAALALAAGGTLAVLGDAPALAAPTRGSGFWVDGEWLGTYVINGQTAICMDPGAAVTDNLASPQIMPVGWVNSDGAALGAHNLAVLSAMVGNPANYSDPAALNLAVRAYLGYGDFVPNIGHVAIDAEAIQPGINDAAVNIMAGAEAATNYWDQTVPVTVTNNIPANGMMVPGSVFTLTVKFPGLPAGVPFVMTVTGSDGSSVTVNATSTSDRPAGLTAVQGTGTVVFNWTVPATGGVTYTIAADMNGSWPGPAPLYFQATPNSSQSMLALLSSMVTWNDNTGLQFQSGYQPAVTSTVSAQQVTAGIPLSDTVKITGGLDGYAYSGTTSLFGPFTTAADALAADPSTLTPLEIVPFAGTYDANGEATFTTDGVTETVLGYYFWWEQVDAQPADGGLAAEQDIADRPNEMAHVGVPTIATQVDHQIAGPGATISDTVNLTALDPAYTYHMGGGLYGPLDPVNMSCDNLDWGTVAAPKVPLVVTIDQAVDPTQADVDGNLTLTGVAPYTIPSTITTAQCYVYAESLEVTSQTPTAVPNVTIETTVTVVAALGQTTETSLAFAPRVVTQVSSQQVKPGTEVSDTVNFFGLVASPNLTYTYTGAVYGPLPPAADGTCNGLDWSTAPMLGTASAGQLDQTLIKPDGTMQMTGVAPYTPTDADAGCLTYTEHLLVTASDGTTIEFDYPKGAQLETVLVSNIVGVPADITVVPVSATTGGSVTAVLPLGIAVGVVLIGAVGGVVLWRRRMQTEVM